METRTFDIKAALEIQFDQMQEWKKMLNDKAYKMLHMAVTERNMKGYERPNDVVRGTDLEAILFNEVLRKL